ncbi:MAG: class IV adenylate cyclase [Patescibacteria group bacterium]
MKKEIETRFLDINKKEIVKMLILLGAVDKGEEKLEEIIFYDKNMKWKGKHRFVRLRKTKNKIELTYKSNQKQTINSAKEIEFEVSDFDKCLEFLNKIGLKIVRRLEKYRHKFKFDKVTIDIDKWPKIPAYIEIEGPSITSVKNICEKLNLDWNKRFDKDARAVFMRYGYDIDNIKVISF